MKAMILAAGRGERLRPLTDTTPKPLIHIGRYRLIEWHILRLASAGVSELVINLSYLGDMIRAALGDGQSYGVKIQYSQEPQPPLETGGGIFQALDLFGDAPFIVVNGDIWTDYPFAQLQAPSKLAHLVMVPNPPHHPQGDFTLHDALLSEQPPGTRYTYSGIGVYSAALFKDCSAGRFALAPLLRLAMQDAALTGELYEGHWYDIGTPQRLDTMRKHVVIQQQEQ